MDPAIDPSVAAHPRKKRRRSAASARFHTLKNERFGLLWYCDYCDAFVSTKQRTRRQHLLGSVHMNNMESYYNKLKRDVATDVANARHQQSLGLWVDAEDVCVRDWRASLLPHAGQQRLENIVRYRRSDDGTETAVAAAATATAAGEQLTSFPLEQPSARGVSCDALLSPEIVVGQLPAPSSLVQMMAPVMVAPNVFVGGAPIRLQSTVAPVRVVPSVRVGSVVVQDEVVVVPPSSFRNDGSGALPQVRIGALPSAPSPRPPAS